MFGKKIRLFTLFGFEVGIDLSWIFIAVLIAWSLSRGLFPMYFEDLTTQTYWMMGIVGAMGLFFSIIVHEFSHSLMARRHGMQMKGITLFIFGGVAEMTEEPANARAEFMMAIVGPLSSIGIGVFFYGLFRTGAEVGWPMPVIGVIMYLSWINFLLAVFNLIPAFPLDGGRVLRSILWKVKGNLRWATKVTSSIGSGFGILLIGLGVYSVVMGNFIGGMWWFLIGLFIRGAAQMSYQQLLTRKALEGEQVRRFMSDHPVSVHPRTSVNDLVEDYVYKYHFKFFPVVEDSERLVGCVTTKEVREIPKEEWPRRNVGDVLSRCSDDNVVSPDTDAMKALSIMNRTQASRLMVVEKDRLVGVIALKDMMNFLSSKVDLEG
jgi:Zn-dependent protease/CBS domain-containing protein